MTYRTIVAHMSDPRRASSMLAAAIPIARSMDAHLVGLSVLPPYVVMPAVEAGGTSITIDEHRLAYAADARTLKDAFLSATRVAPPLVEWREADAVFGSVVSTVMEHGRCADLIVASQVDAQWSYSHLIEDPVRLAMEAGRPLLLVPNRGEIALPAKRVTIAWNSRREAARAVFDALPLLKAAQSVNVLWVNPEKDPAHAGDLPGDEISMALARHGIKCEASRATAIGADVGPEILRQTNAYGSSLLVMGCYGHSRLREMILGGVSRHIFAEANLPVLLSH